MGHSYRLLALYGLWDCNVPWFSWTSTTYLNCLLTYVIENRPISFPGRRSWGDQTKLYFSFSDFCAIVYFITVRVCFCWVWFCFSVLGHEMAGKNVSKVTHFVSVWCTKTLTLRAIYLTVFLQLSISSLSSSLLVQWQKIHWDCDISV